MHRVLVVDDHLDTAHTLALLLRASGHAVEFAINGYAALEIARQFRPDIVLLDLLLPDLDGCEVARRLRQQEPARNARILAITGSGSEELQTRAREAGCDEYLLKPLDPRLIDTLITQAAGK